MIQVRTTFQRNTWRKDSALLDSAGVTLVQDTHRHAVVHQNCFDVTRVFAAIASISFVIFVPLVFDFRDELFGGIAASRCDVCASHGHLHCLERLGEEALCPSSGNKWAYSGRRPGGMLSLV
jgi:hypothetical protein